MPAVLLYGSSTWKVNSAGIHHFEMDNSVNSDLRLKESLSVLEEYSWEDAPFTGLNRRGLHKML